MARRLAEGVLAYDANLDGRIVFTNGHAIFRQEPDGQRETILSERLIEQVFFIPD